MQVVYGIRYSLYFSIIINTNLQDLIFSEEHKLVIRELISTSRFVVGRSHNLIEKDVIK